MNKLKVMALIFVCAFETVDAQRGEKSISVGPVISFPTEPRDNRTTGLGVEGDGQYGFSDESSAVVQLRLTYFGKNKQYLAGEYFRNRGGGALSLKGGYRYQFSNSGFYGNVLIGIEQQEGAFVAGAVIGGGKRIPIKDVYFIDAGFDYGINAGSTFNIKATFSVLRRPKR